MNHNHVHCCAHDKVKYCKVCQVVHCLDCSKEWRTYNFSGGYLGQVGWTYPLTTTIASGQAGLTTATADNLTNLYKSCAHTIGGKDESR